MKEKDKSVRRAHGLPFRLVMFLVLLLIGIIPMIVYLFGMSRSVRDALVNETKERMYSECSNIAQFISYIAAPEDSAVLSDVHSQMVDSAKLLNGRMLLVDPSYRSIADTYEYDRVHYVAYQGVLSLLSTDRESITEISESNISYFLKVSPKGSGRNYVLCFMAPLQTKITLMSAIRKRSILLMTIILLVTICVGFYFAFMLGRPLKALKESSISLYDGQRDDIVGKRYTELVETSETVNELMEQLHAIDASRKEFVSNVSHELKTPITSIRVLADSLMSMPKGEVPIDLYEDFMTDISDELNREAKIIDDLLTLVRTDESNTTLNYSMVDIHAMLEGLLKRLQPLAGKKNVELVLESFRRVDALVDEVKLVLAISNLVENAIKYNRESGHVRVSLNADHKYFYIKVEDSGFGIPAESQTKIFERFYRVDKARSREMGGTGLGLAITRNIVQMHKGIIRVFSKENEGTTFTVRIPLNNIADSNPEGSGE
ncbi:MAG: GHKL domain-containing protein [Lachnospiraceae bacterium]|nr:GHKL domain-containing protein [Lachnospiraceae bacterium]